jgi:hypothetical protein
LHSVKCLLSINGKKFIKKLLYLIINLIPKYKIIINHLILNLLSNIYLNPIFIIIVDQIPHINKNKYNKIIKFTPINKLDTLLKNLYRSTKSLKEKCHLNLKRHKIKTLIINHSLKIKSITLYPFGIHKQTQLRINRPN